MQKKSAGEKIVAVTCYDASFARLVDRAKVDLVLIGDSAAHVMLGRDDTKPIDLETMKIFAKSVSLLCKKAFLICDMPFGSFHESVAQTVKNACEILSEAGVHSLKLEGCSDLICASIKQMSGLGIICTGHLGYTPQSSESFSKPTVQGARPQAFEKIKNEAERLVESGIKILFLEMTNEKLTKEISKSLSIPVIGIGSGPDCDGQILVLQDLLGMNQDFSPKFLKRYENLEQKTIAALNNYSEEVKSQSFPGPDHCYGKKSQ